MTGVVTRHRRGVNIIEGADGAIYYNYGLPLKKGTEVYFYENAFDQEIADDVKPFPINEKYSLRDNLISAAIGILIGAAIVFLAVKPVHAADLTSEEISMVAKLISAEAEYQPFEGKKLVASVVLNRVDSDIFPDTVEEVIFQDDQFSVIKNGAWDKAIPIEEDFEAVQQELKHRSNHEVLYFTAGGYGDYGQPAFKEGEHFFSK